MFFVHNVVAGKYTQTMNDDTKLKGEDSEFHLNSDQIHPDFFPLITQLASGSQSGQKRGGAS